MATSHRAELQQIRTFPQLIRFLRDEMGWPIESEEYDDLVFDYEAEELGLDAASAAKIKEIKRLRPLAANQPWGIFFVSFEPKRLPVVALRRILSAFVMRKRASANAAERMAWETDDLLFISNFGEGEERQLSFAHFSQDEHGGLPTLRVLGWDNLDTLLHLDHVADQLTERLAWPRSESDMARWRETWSSAFTLRHGEVIATSKALAVRLAELARAIRDRIKTVLSIETGSGPVTQLMKAFKEALVHDLNPDDFADMYAQTVAYGLLSARIANPEAGTANGFAGRLPISSPFLKELMETFLHVGDRSGVGGTASRIDFDELGVSEVVELLDSPKTNMEAVVRDFGDKNPQEDPVIHFYQDFLKEYDEKQKVKRGVFYTPRPVVSYIVRSVDELLRSEFGLVDGLADITTWGQMIERYEGLAIPKGVESTTPFVSILDPATGTGTFLVETIDVVHRTLVEKWNREGHGENEILDRWNDYVPKHLLPRLYGYELLMAPYAIAHLKIGLKLHETGYQFRPADRVRVYLTNSLEPASNIGQQALSGMLPALAHEAQAVSEVKQSQRFTVCVGNPPYSVVSQNSSAWIAGLMELYKQDVRDERNLQPLSDDYIKFIRLGHALVEKSGVGVLAYISNHTYLSGVIHRGMRQRLLGSFDRIDVLDLHGSALLGLESPDGTPDQNVFDIQQGVCISTFVRSEAGVAGGALRRADLWGQRSSKYEILSSGWSVPPFSEIVALAPYFFFDATCSADSIYQLGPSVAELFQTRTAGLVTGKDSALIAFDRASIVNLVADLADDSIPNEDIARVYGISDTSGWPVSSRRRDVVRDVQRETKVRLCSYRPFDDRFTYYSDFLQRSRFGVLGSMLRPNLALITSRLVKGEPPAHFFVSRLPVEKIFLSPKTSNNAFVFPLYRYGGGESLEGMEGSYSALSREVARRFADCIGASWSEGSGAAGEDIVTSEDVLRYAYAVFYSPGYRNRYADPLRIDFPRLPLPGSGSLFRVLSMKGDELVALHLLESPILDSAHSVHYFGGGSPMVVRQNWSNDTVWLDAGTTTKGQETKQGSIGFRGVPEDVWRFHFGGYQVCEKWLKDRKGRTLSDDDIAHYQKIVVAIAETIRIMAEIDEVIEEHGGWPGAFQSVET